MQYGASIEAGSPRWMRVSVYGLGWSMLAVVIGVIAQRLVHGNDVVRPIATVVGVSGAGLSLLFVLALAVGGWYRVFRRD